MNVRIIIVFLSYSINPFIRKVAIMNTDNYTGYLLLQTTNLVGNIIYISLQQSELRLQDITARNIKYSFVTSSLTILSSYQMMNLTKSNSMSNAICKIHVLTIISTYILDHLINSNKLSLRKVVGIFFMLSGILITDN